MGYLERNATYQEAALKLLLSLTVLAVIASPSIAKVKKPPIKHHIPVRHAPSFEDEAWGDKPKQQAERELEPTVRMLQKPQAREMSISRKGSRSKEQYVPDYVRQALELSKITGRPVTFGGGPIADIGVSETELHGVGPHRRPIHIAPNRNAYRRYYGH